jgi:hypothetical protein
VTLSWESRV